MNGHANIYGIFRLFRKNDYCSRHFEETTIIASVALYYCRTEARLSRSLKSIKIYADGENSIIY